MNRITKNFASVVAELEAASPSPKATAFLAKLVGQINARGEAWIIENALSLGIMRSADDWADLCPVADNRLFYIQKFQLALAK
jgi:hypothetical protein